MTTLKELLLGGDRRDAAVRGMTDWVERFVVEKSGLRGIALRAGLSAAKAARPDIVPRAVARLLPEFADALEPLWQRFQKSGERDFGAFLKRHSEEAGAAIMGVADARVAASSNRALHSGYKGLRGTLEKELDNLLPGIAKMLAQNLGAKKAG
ncbi:MAG TPA: hypothetical protein VM240_08910 [Verrucomicrobiae bacterium]|nr:hypothetical protein [Verrucomicrobiae bacterium]